MRSIELGIPGQSLDHPSERKLSNGFPNPLLPSKSTLSLGRLPQSDLIRLIFYHQLKNLIANISRDVFPLQHESERPARHPFFLALKNDHLDSILVDIRHLNQSYRRYRHDPNSADAQLILDHARSVSRHVAAIQSQFDSHPGEIQTEDFPVSVLKEVCRTLSKTAALIEEEFQLYRPLLESDAEYTPRFQPILLTHKLEDWQSQMSSEGALKATPPKTFHFENMLNGSSSKKVLADPLLLKSVIYNLLFNAYKHGGSDIWVRLESAGDSHLRILIQDNGQFKDLPYAISMFSTSPARPLYREGTDGLGLALSIQSMRLHLDSDFRLQMQSSDGLVIICDSHGISEASTGSLPSDRKTSFEILLPFVGESCTPSPSG